MCPIHLNLSYETKESFDTLQLLGIKNDFCIHIANLIIITSRIIVKIQNH